MDLPFALATYFICWWMALFMVLPFGVRTQEEEGEIVPGTVPSAPGKPHILKKLAITTVVGGVLFVIVYFIITTGILTIEHIPLLPSFDNVD